MEELKKSHWRAPFKIYFLIITLVGVIGTLISVGILTFAIGKQILITNDEYIAWDRYYELDNCNSTMIPKPTKADPGNYWLPTEAEKNKCKTEKKVELIQARKANFKTDVLSWSIWGILFIVLLLTHYPKFKKSNKND